jgi:N-terminal acetyltransferase B complex catalytic subunit
MTKKKEDFLIENFSKGKPENYHGHVTALTVAPEFRRIGVSSQLMALLENVSEQ